MFMSLKFTTTVASLKCKFILQETTSKAQRINKPKGKKAREREAKARLKTSINRSLKINIHLGNL